MVRNDCTVNALGCVSLTVKSLTASEMPRLFQSILMRILTF